MLFGSSINKILPRGTNVGPLLLDYCLTAGFNENEFVTEEGALVVGNNGAVSVATDDVLHYMRALPEELLGL